MPDILYADDPDLCGPWVTANTGGADRYVTDDTED